MKDTEVSGELINSVILPGYSFWLTQYTFQLHGSLCARINQFRCITKQIFFVESTTVLAFEVHVSGSLLVICNCTCKSKIYSVACVAVN